MTNSTKRIGLAVVVLGLVVGVAGRARADIVLDHSPVAEGGSSGGFWSNSANGQNFADAVDLASTTNITGMDIYTRAGRIGQSVTIRIWSDSSGQPGDLLTSFTAAVSAIDSVEAYSNEVRIHSDFTTPYTLTGGTTYWIGMSGTNNVDIGQISLVGGSLGAGSMYEFEGLAKNGFSQVGHMAFRLDDDSLATPEPSTFISASIAGVMVLGYAWRRRKAKHAA